MRYEQALKIGKARAEQAAEVLRRWTGIKAIAVCAVKTAYDSEPRTTKKWEPVGQRSYKEIARDDGVRGRGNYHLLVLDKNGAAKACSMERFPLGEVLELADRLPLSVAAPGKGELWKQLAEEDYRMYAVYRAKYPDA
jgi:hypothetical protein